MVRPGPRGRGAARRVRPPHLPVAAFRLRRGAHRGPRGSPRVRAGRHRRRRDAGPTRWPSRCCGRRGCCRVSGMAYRPLPAGPLTPVDGLQLQGRPIEARYALCIGLRRPLRHGRRRLPAAGAGPCAGWRWATVDRERARDRGRGGLRRAPPGRDARGPGLQSHRPGHARSGWVTGRAGWSTCAAAPLDAFDGSFALRAFGIATFRLARTRFRHRRVGPVDRRGSDGPVRSSRRRPRSPAAGGSRRAGARRCSRSSSSSWRTSARRSHRREPAGRGPRVRSPDGGAAHSWTRPRSFTSRGRNALKAKTPADVGSRSTSCSRTDVELVGDEDAPGRGHADGPAGQVDDRSVEVAVLDEDGSDGQRHPDVGQQLVVGVRLGQGQRRSGRRRWRCRPRT